MSKTHFLRISSEIFHIQNLDWSKAASILRFFEIVSEKNNFYSHY
ncbi:hypothetical protein J587_1654 [Acinetobacter baumannii 144107]|nr:hypothetical protein J587_1654 [Acinetobacter baumannii 144107]